MNRHAMKSLVQSKESARRKPLFVKGARQVGKTWLLQEFGRRHYDKVAYINMDNNERMTMLFEEDLDIDRLLTTLQIKAGTMITAPDTLIIFDEV